MPAYLRKVSAYAERGTALHTAMALLIDNARSLDGLVGEMINDYTITRDDVENALRPVYTYVDALLDAPGAEFYLEQRVVFPTIPGAFGTADLIVRIGDTVHVVDFKFGAGVRVLALYPDGDEDVINAQLLFYAAAARHSLPKFFAGVDEIVLTILQPQSIEPDAEMVSSVTVTPAELDAFVTIYRAACEEALSPTPRLERGAWCRFCAAKPICPAHTGPLLDLAQFAMPAPPRRAGSTERPICKCSPTAWTSSTRSRTSRKALHDQAKRALEQRRPSCPATRSRPAAPSGTGTTKTLHRRAARPRPRPRRRHRRDHALAEASRNPRQSARLQSSRRINRFASLRGLPGAERKRARPGARTERDRAVICRGTRSLPGGRQ